MSIQANFRHQLTLNEFLWGAQELRLSYVLLGHTYCSWLLNPVSQSSLSIRLRQIR